MCAVQMKSIKDLAERPDERVNVPLCWFPIFVFRLTMVEIKHYSTRGHLKTVGSEPSTKKELH